MSCGLCFQLFIGITKRSRLHLCWMWMHCIGLQGSSDCGVLHLLYGNTGTQPIESCEARGDLSI